MYVKQLSRITLIAQVLLTVSRQLERSNCSHRGEWFPKLLEKSICHCLTGVFISSPFLYLFLHHPPLHPKYGESFGFWKITPVPGKKQVAYTLIILPSLSVFTPTVNGSVLMT